MSGAFTRRDRETCTHRKEAYWQLRQRRNKASARQGRSRIVSSYEKLGRTTKIFFPRVCRHSMTMTEPWFWTSKLQNSKKIICC
jgi:hypothetical protein